MEPFVSKFQKIFAVLLGTAAQREFSALEMLPSMKTDTDGNIVMKTVE